MAGKERKSRKPSQPASITSEPALDARRVMVRIAVLAMIAVVGFVGPTAEAAAAQDPFAVSRSVQRIAHQQVGKPYSWGSAGPRAFDCSGLVHYVFRRAGARKLSRMSARQLQARAVVPISRSQLRRGDLIFYGRPATHVGIYMGDGYMIDASASRSRVVKRRPWGTPTSYGRVRYSLL